MFFPVRIEPDTPDFHILDGAKYTRRDAFYDVVSVVV